MKSLNIRRGRSSILSHRSHRIYTWYRVSRTHELKLQKLCSKNSDIVRRDILTRSEPFVEEDACKEILSSRRLGH
jgi:hypothetical protein